MSYVAKCPCLPGFKPYTSRSIAWCADSCPKHGFYIKLVSFFIKDLLFSKILYFIKFTNFLETLRKIIFFWIFFHSIFLKNWEHVTSEPTISMITSRSSPCNETSQVHASFKIYVMSWSLSNICIGFCKIETLTISIITE